MGAIDQEAREELRALRPDVLRVAAGIVANQNLSVVMKDLVAGRDVSSNDTAATVVAELALGIVRAVDRVTGGDA